MYPYQSLSREITVAFKGVKELCQWQCTMLNDVECRSRSMTRVFTGSADVIAHARPGSLHPASLLHPFCEFKCVYFGLISLQPWIQVIMLVSASDTFCVFYATWLVVSNQIMLQVKHKHNIYMIR